MTLFQDWGLVPRRPTVQDACSKCTAQQQKGLDFSQAQVGVSIFGGLRLGGGCSIGKWLGKGKRDYQPRGTSLEKRTFGGLPGLSSLLNGGDGSVSAINRTSGRHVLTKIYRNVLSVR